MRYAKWLVLLLCMGFQLRADTSLNTDLVKKMVVFLYPAHNDGTVDRDHPLGTGFLVSIQNKYYPVPISVDAEHGITQTIGALYLVTARHIVNPEWALCSMPQPNVIWMRLNKMKYDPTKDATGVEYVALPLIQSGKRKFLVLDDDTVDAAVIEVGTLISRSDPKQKDRYETLSIPLSMFATPAEAKALKMGDSVISAGLVPGRSGEGRNYPFFKFGEISNIPNEPTPVGCGDGLELRLENVWFLAASLVSGNSGSPIIYVPPELCRMTRCTRGLNRFIIIGVQSSSIAGSYLAGMTPIEGVFKIIEQIGDKDLDLYRGDESQRPKSPS